jgi:hypothetical protein
MTFSRGSKSRASPYFAFATDGCFVSITTTKKWESIAVRLPHDLSCWKR